MAIDFNALTSRLEETTATGFDVDIVTVAGWIRADGSGEAAGTTAINRAFQAGPSSNGAIWGHRGGTANAIAFGYPWSTATAGVGMWTVTATDGVWHAISFTYDRTLTTNDPTGRVDYADATVTEIHTPSGTAGTPTAGYNIGNNSGQTRTWNGCIAHVQFFNTALTSEEQDACLRFPGSVTNGGVLWVPMIHATDLTSYVVSGGVWVPSGSNPTATDIAQCTNDEPSYPDVAAGLMVGSSMSIIGRYDV